MDEDKATFSRILNLDFLSAYNPDIIVSSIYFRLSTLKIDNLDQYEEILLNTMEERLVLQSLILNGYSEFFREPLIFALLESEILPSVFQNKKNEKTIRMWSVGCSSGHEAYSLLLVANKIAREVPEDYELIIYATDINQNSLNRGIEGVYNKVEIKNIPMGYIDDYFSKTGNFYAINADLKNKVHFLHYDILDPYSLTPPECVFKGFDIIICSNVLIYYNDSCQKFILEKLTKTLSYKGYLILGSSESSILVDARKLSAINVKYPIAVKSSFL